MAIQAVNVMQAYVAEGPAEEWNLDGIVWKSKS